MIKHVVFYKLKNPSQEVCDQLTQKFTSMIGKIEGLIDIKCGQDVLHSERSYDYCLVVDLKDIDTLSSYAVHPVHLPVKAFVQSVSEKSKCVDFEF